MRSSGDAFQKGPVRKLSSALSKPSVETKFQMLGGGIEQWYRKIRCVPPCKLPICLLRPISQQFSSRNSVWAGVAGSLQGFVSKDESLRNPKVGEMERNSLDCDVMFLWSSAVMSSCV